MKNKSLIRKLLVLPVVLITCIPQILAQFPSGKYIYLKTSDTWKADGARFAVCFQWKVGGGQDDSWYSCLSAGETDIYYAVAPDNYYDMFFCRMNGANSTNSWSNVWNQSDKLSYSKNYYVKSSGWNGTVTNSSNYAPIMSTVTLSDNGTSIVSGSGTSVSPYLVYVGATIKVSASGTKAVADPAATINYDFKQSSTSKQNGTGTTYEFSASASANTTYTINLDGYTKVSSTSSTKKAATALYYKTIAVPVDPSVTLSASKTTGIKVGETITLTATGSNASNITKYEFYEGSTKKGTVTTSSTTAEYSYTPTTTGNKTVKVIMTYSSGTKTVTSSNVSLTLNTPSVSLAVKSGSPTDIYLGEATTIMKATPSNVGAGVTPSYVFTDQAATPVSSSSQTSTEWTYTPGVTGTKTMKVTMTVGGSTYTATATVNVYEHWTIYVKDNCSWGNIYNYNWDGSGNEGLGSWPGTAATVYQGSWYTITFDSKYPNVVLHGNNSEKTNDITAAKGTYASGTFWDFEYTHEYGGIKYYNLHSVSLSDPTVSMDTGDGQTYMVNTTMLFATGHITNYGGDGTYPPDMLEVGFKIGETEYPMTCMNTDNHYFWGYITGLTPGTTYTVQAYAKNLHGTGVSSNSKSLTTRASGTYTIKVQVPHNAAAPYIHAYTDVDCDGVDVENATFPGIQLSTKVATGTAKDWWEYSMPTAYNNFRISNGNSNKQTRAFTAPQEDKCYWYDPNGGTENDRGNEMLCPYLTPQLMINTPGAPTTFDYYEMSTSPTISKTMTLAAKSTYKFKIVYGAEWYGKASSPTLTRASNSLSGLDPQAGDEDHIQITTDAAGDYKFTFTAPGTVTVTYPTAYTITFGKGTGGATITATGSASGSLESENYVAQGENVTFNQTANTGYTFTGWYTTKDTGGSAVSGMSTSDNVLDNVTANKTVYSRYSENMTTVTLVASPTGKGTFTSGGNTVTSVSAGKTTKPSVTAVAGTGYRLTGTIWSKNNNNITLSSTTANPVTVTGCGTASTTATLTATFTPKQYTITLNNHGATTTGTTSVTATYDSNSNISSNISRPAKTGYAFGGYWTGENGTGTMLINASGAWQTNNSWINSSGKWVNDGNVELHAKWTANTYTVSFDNNGGSGATPGNKTVTYGQAYGTLPVGPTPPGADQFVGWFTDKTGGTQVTSSTIVSTASDHKLWARFESTFTVTVQYKCGADVLRAPTTTHASETSVAAEITAPEILGYSFVNWTGDNATFADATSATTTVNVTSATTVVANYNAVPMVYFKNNLDWDDVYVTFDCAFNGEVPSLSGKPYYKMTRLGQSSDIFYCVIPSTYTENNYEHWAWYIAFDNTGTGYNESKHTGTYAFNSGEFIGRKDFDPRATMFIPYDGDTKSLNGGTTYQTGCWLQYNTNYSAYRVRVNTYVQGSGGSEVQDIELRSDVAGATEFKAKVYLGNANHVYGVMLYKDHMKNTNDIWYTNVNNEANTITSATTSLPWSWQKCEEDWQRCRVKTESLGNYIFTVSFATGRPMVDIEYPVTIGDFRLVYKDLATWNITHDEDWQQISPVFKKKANRVDTASFFVSYGSSPTVELQKCTAINPSTGAETWTKQGDNINISSITKKGVYNFTVIQNNDASGATAAYLGAYSGKYYVRTDVSDGGWNDYKSTANAMTYTEYSMEHGGSSGPYSYYFMRHVDAGSNIKFLVANDYSLCLTDTMIDDTYAHEWIEREANVRFTWNHTNNEIHRAYISGSSYIYDRFLVLEGDDKLFDADGHPLTGTYQVAGLNEYEMNFTDDQNWVYETTVQAKPNERVKLTAKFNDKIQYFYGAEGERTEATTYQLIGGTGSTMYKMRVVYDFKTNRLLAAWLPNGDISDPTPINADVMIIRYHQDDAQQITFSGDGKLTDVKTVYGAMEFNKYRLNNQGEEYPHGNLGISQYERDLFFISFPFDVKLNDVFGFGTYGKHWIIEYYDGKTRAKNGYWKDSPTNWKFVTKAMKDSYTLKANEGYVLALDLDELKPESSVWNYGVENVYLYFPSTAAVEDIQATHKTVEIDTVGYQCTINRNTAQGDRRVKDSHWHLIGVPSYANADHSTSDSWAESKGDLEQTIYYPNIDPAAWTSAAPFVYDWDASSNKFGVLRATSYSFKPMHSYLVQYARDTLEWRQVNTTPAAIAARRAMFAKEPCDFRLELLQDENVIDQAFISMRDDEEVTAEFDFNYDLSKMLYGAFTSKSNIYTFAGNEEVAANCLPFKEETTVVPVGLTVDEEGEYIFSIPDGTSGVGVTLVDNERQIRTNLALTDYMTYLPAGDHNNRFVLEISPIEQIVTGVEMINGENGDASLNGENVTGVCKKLIDGLLYIVKDGKVFDARGARLQ